MYTAFVLMGYPGSGKTSFGKNFASTRHGSLYLSSDDLRIELYGFRDQTHNEEVFSELYKRATNHISKGKGDVIIDATNLSRKDRLHTIEALSSLHIKGEANLDLIMVVRPIMSIMKANKTRPEEARLPEDVLINMLGRFQMPSFNEGWDNIYFYYNHEHQVSGYTRLYELRDMAHDNPHHNETLKEHINKCIDLYYDEEFNTGANYGQELPQYHDLGKFFVRRYNEEKGYHQYIGHSAVSAYIYLTTILFDKRHVDGVSLSVWQNLVSFKSLFKDLDKFRLFYMIYYHDLFYTFREDQIENAVKSLRKPSKGIESNLTAILEGFGAALDIFIILFFYNMAGDLRSFNRIDRYRENKQL